MPSLDDEITAALAAGEQKAATQQIIEAADHAGVLISRYYLMLKTCKQVDDSLISALVMQVNGMYWSKHLGYDCDGVMIEE